MRPSQCSPPPLLCEEKGIRDEANKRFRALHKQIPPFHIYHQTHHMLSWKNITVQQFQDVYKLSENKDLQEMDRLEKIISVLFDKTERQIDEMSVEEFTKLANQCAFVLNDEKIPGKPVRYIKVNSRRYRIEYNPKRLLTNMHHRQYVECMHFSEKMVENMQYIMASLVQPVKFGFIKLKNTAKRHELIAEDMLKARFIDVYHTGVFFCKLYVNSMQAIRDYLKADMMNRKMTREQVSMMETALQAATDGFTALHR
jgi:hypothetical protein